MAQPPCFFTPYQLHTFTLFIQFNYKFKNYLFLLFGLLWVYLGCN